MTESTSAPPLPPDFLNQVGQTLAQREGVDKDLAAILVEHLLTEKPKANAVAEARRAIEATAASRAMTRQAADNAEVAK